MSMPVHCRCLSRSGVLLPPENTAYRPYAKICACLTSIHGPGINSRQHSLQLATPVARASAFEKVLAKHLFLDVNQKAAAWFRDPGVCLRPYLFSAMFQKPGRARST